MKLLWNRIIYFYFIFGECPEEDHFPIVIILPDPSPRPLALDSLPGLGQAVLQYELVIHLAAADLLLVVVVNVYLSCGKESSDRFTSDYM